MSEISNLEIYPEQHYLYASNCGHHSIVCFSIDENTACLLKIFLLVTKTFQ